MSDISLSPPVAEDAAAYETIADQLLRDMRVLNERMQNNRVEIERLDAETKLLKAEGLRHCGAPDFRGAERPGGRNARP